VTLYDFIPIIISAISLLVSLITAYKTLFQRFAGRIWLGNYLVLNRVNDAPAITLTVFLENSGAKVGILDDLRMIVEHQESGTSYKFFPVVTGDKYNILADGETENEEWISFSGIVLPPSSRVRKYVAFKPVVDNFRAQKGHFKISVHSRWYDNKKWEISPLSLPFELAETDVGQWNEQKKALQVATDNIQRLR
jgi:hypothetical protein